MKRFSSLVVLTVVLGASLVLATGAPAEAQQQRPNILIIWGDDIGYWNPSAYHRGMMGYQTPNIDRLAKEGAMFTDCTASRAAPPGARRSSPVSRPSAPA